MTGVLIVDDSVFMRKYLYNITKRAGVDVIWEAKNGVEAIGQVTSHQPDLVIMDITMETLDGLSALKQIQQIHSEAKVIICSSLGHRWNIDEAMKLGAKDFIVKPFSVWKAIECIKKVLSQ